MRDLRRWRVRKLERDRFLRWVQPCSAPGSVPHSIPSVDLAPTLTSSLSPDCYGVPYIPEGQWLCRKCTVAPDKLVVRSCHSPGLNPTELTPSPALAELRALPKRVRRVQADHQRPMGSLALRNLDSRYGRVQHGLHGANRRGREHQQEQVETREQNHPDRCC